MMVLALTCLQDSRISSGLVYLPRSADDVAAAGAGFHDVPSTPVTRAQQPNHKIVF